MTPRSPIERLLATVPLDERLRASDSAAVPLGRVEPPPAPLVTEPLPASFRPGSPLPSPPAAMTTAPLPPAPIAPTTITRPVVIEVPAPIRRTPQFSGAEERSPAARAVAPRPHALAVSWLFVAATAAFFGMVGALLMRWWLG
ncbi:hypothetical protein WME94_54550 [Sorangium sp. So ce429]